MTRLAAEIREGVFMPHTIFRNLGNGSCRLPRLIAVLFLSVAASGLAAQAISWELEWQSGADWTYRRDQAAAVFNNRLWVLGGNDGGNRNDVWSSADGIDWSQETAAAQWSARHAHAVAVFDNKLWVIGGSAGSNQNDVWSSPDGITWAQETAAAPWPTRRYHAVAVFNNRLWVIGGNGPGTSATNVLNDVWSSTDGINWTQETAAAQWTPRQGHAVAVFNNRLWVLGGSESGSTSRVNDIWSSADGITWTQETAAAQWSSREGHAALVFNGKLWVLAGNAGNNQKDVWSSADGVTWTQETAAAPWVTRQNFGAAVHDNRLWVMGGNGPGAGTAHRLNDVWSSSDGIAWVQETPPPQWSAREGHATAVFNNRLWILGGNDGNQLNDVWSSADGVSWNLETAAAPWPTRRYHAAVAFDGRLWVMGGNGPTTTTSNRLNDVWSSADGINWTPETATAGWSGREGLAVEVFNNKLWVIGGNAGTNQTDVWSSVDGVTWILETANAGWPRRRYHTTAVFDSRLWVMGGNGTGTGNTARQNDVWSSTDGITWVEETGSAQWSARFGHASAVFNNKLWVLGGYASGNQNDVWSSSDGISWTQDAPAPWSTRVDHTAAAFNGRLWLLGGAGGTPSSPRDDVWSLEPQSAPQITSIAPVAVIAGQQYSYTISAVGNPLPAISVSGLPAWLSFDNVDTISGTPNEVDIGMTVPITVTAANTLGTDDQVFQIDVAGAPPVISTTTLPAATAGVPYSFTVAATGIPAPGFNASGLPAWMSLNPATGELTGTPSFADIGLSAMFDITADNGWPPADTVAYDIQVNGLSPIITSTAPTDATVGTQYSYTIVATGSPAPTFSVTGAPPWLTLIGAVLRGTPGGADVGLTGTITITAENGWTPSDMQSFQIDVVGTAPSFTSTPILSATPKELYSYTAVATGTPSPSLSVTSSLPAWLSFDSGTGVLTGTPGNSDARTSVVVTILATNSVAPDAMQTFTIEVERSPDAKQSENNEGSCTASAVRVSPWMLGVVMLAFLTVNCFCRRSRFSSGA